MNALPPVAVMHGPGSVGPLGILASSADICVPVLVADSAEADGRRLLESAAGLLDCVDAAGMDHTAVATALRRRGVAGITTFSDDRIVLTARVAAELGLPFHGMQTAAALRYKDRQRARLNARGVSVTRHAGIAGVAGIRAAVAAVGLPAVLKPVAGSGSASVRRVDTVAELAEAVAAAAGTRWCLEELLAGAAHPAADWLGDYCSVETLTLGPRRHVALAVTERLPLAAPMRETGLLLPGGLPAGHLDAVIGLAAAALDALDVRCGLSHVEVKLTAGGPRVIEVNGRLGGFVPELLHRVSAVDAVALALAAALGATGPAAPARCTGHALAYLTYAPAGEPVVVRLADPRRLAAVPGVFRVEQHVAPGAVAPERLGTPGRLQTIWMAAATLDDMRTAKVRVDAVLASGNEFRAC